MNYFRKYPSLINHYAIGKSNQVLNHLDDNFYRTEKIHGANASYILTSGGQEFYAKRSQIIDENESDKLFTSLPQYVSGSIKQSAKDVLDCFSNIGDHVIVYGEFFGSGIQHTQYNIAKQRQKTFKVFSVFVCDQSSENKSTLVLGYDDLQDFFNKEDLVPIFGVNTLRNWLNTPLIDESVLGGFSEGYVYHYFYRHYIDETHPFFSVKHKTEKFKEVSRIPKEKKAPDFSSKELNVREDLARYVTKNRVNNVLSHGEYELIPQNIGKIMKLVKDDIIKEYSFETYKDIRNIDLTKLLEGHSRTIALIIKSLIEEETLAKLNKQE